MAEPLGWEDGVRLRSVLRRRHDRARKHDGDARLADHVANAVLKVDGRGPRITKVHRTIRRHIDLAVAAVMAYDVANSRQPQQRSVYEERYVLVL